MGALTSFVTFAGGIAAGTGAMITTEGLIIELGSGYASTKLGKLCVVLCAGTVGGGAFVKVNDMFTEQAMEFWDFVDKAKAYRAKVKVEKDGKTIVDINHDGTKSEAEKEVIKDLRSEDQ